MPARIDSRSLIDSSMQPPGGGGRLPRPSYPSDEVRNRPFVRVHLTIRNHPSYSHVFADPMMRGMWLGLLVVARAAYAGETNDRVTLSRSDVAWITGTSARYGIPRLRKLCAALKYELEERPSAEPEESQQEAGAEPAESQRGASAEPAPSQLIVHVRNLQRKQAPRSAIRRSKSKRKIQEEEEEHSGAPEAAGAEGLEAGLAIANYLADAIKRADPQAKVPADLTAWAKEAERMLRLDKRQPEQVRAAIDWLFGANLESEAQFVVLSMKSLRTKYDRMRQQARKERGGSGGSKNVRSAARRIAERHGVGPGGNAREARVVRTDAGKLPSGNESGCGADAGDVPGDDG